MLAAFWKVCFPGLSLNLIDRKLWSPCDEPTTCRASLGQSPPGPTQKWLSLLRHQWSCKPLSISEYMSWVAPPPSNNSDHQGGINCCWWGIPINLHLPLGGGTSQSMSWERGGISCEFVLHPEKAYPVNIEQDIPQKRLLTRHVLGMLQKSFEKMQSTGVWYWVSPIEDLYNWIRVNCYELNIFKTPRCGTSFLEGLNVMMSILGYPKVSNCKNTTRNHILWGIRPSNLQNIFQN